jgi:hypothetical protein|uniref:Uncharacterized protein n=1 Tax=Picea glauca TaxID=3330 RepID=A0A101M0V3_PICGL|nr:hypothetical protein ABT39_MTgene4161 [Picea glauca]QHR89016.1 hypothetical protein Q903MT_gene3035 [Picea sitchensis]
MLLLLLLLLLLTFATLLLLLTMDGRKAKLYLHINYMSF